MLPYLMAKELLGMRLIPPVVEEDQDRRTRFLGDYRFTYININYLPIAAIFAMQYGQALYHLIIEVFIVELSLVPI